MAYVNNGDFRRTTLSVDKTVGGVSIDGYPKEYDITSAFGVFSELTTEQFQQLSTEDYSTRLSAFYAYVNGQEGAIDAANYVYTEGEEPYGQDLVSCPIGG